MNSNRDTMAGALSVYLWFFGWLFSSQLLSHVSKYYKTIRGKKRENSVVVIFKSSKRKYFFFFFLGISLKEDISKQNKSDHEV